MRAIYIGDCDIPAPGTVGDVTRHCDFFKPGLHYGCYWFTVDGIDYIVGEDDLNFDTSNASFPLGNSQPRSEARTRSLSRLWVGYRGVFAKKIIS